MMDFSNRRFGSRRLVNWRYSGPVPDSLIATASGRSGPVEAVYTEISCEICAEHPQYLPGSCEPFVRAARWALVVKDCCHDDALVDYLLCEVHHSMIADQALPGVCDRCGAVAHTMDDIVYSQAPLGRVIGGFRLSC